MPLDTKMQPMVSKQSAKVSTLRAGGRVIVILATTSSGKISRSCGWWALIRAVAEYEINRKMDSNDVCQIVGSTKDNPQQGKRMNSEAAPTRESRARTK